MKKQVKRIDTDYMTDSVVVEFDPSFITKEEIRNRLERSGYHANSPPPCSIHYGDRMKTIQVYIAFKTHKNLRT